jgi:uncharacterized protein YaaQ
MKLIIAIVQDKDSNQLSAALVKADIRATKLSSTGGFLRAGNTTFLIGTDDEKVDEVIELIHQNGRMREQLVSPMAAFGTTSDAYIPHPIEVPVGGATVFVLPIDRFEHF